MGAVPNGPITHASCLSMALRYFVGGIHWILRSFTVLVMANLWRVWLVVDAIHQSPELNFCSKTHADQTECANGFCIGTNGGILVWILSAAWIANFARDM